MTYKLIKNGEYEGMQCLKCGHLTFNPQELQTRFCANCDMTHEEYEGLMAILKNYIDISQKEPKAE